MKTLAKLTLIVVFTTACRVVGQMLIPGGESPILESSIFAKKGILPIVFVIYGIISYSIIAALYLLIEKNLTGHRIIKGLKNGISCCADIYSSFKINDLQTILWTVLTGIVIAFVVLWYGKAYN